MIANLFHALKGDVRELLTEFSKLRRELYKSRTSHYSLFCGRQLCNNASQTPAFSIILHNGCEHTGMAGVALG